MMKKPYWSQGKWEVCPDLWPWVLFSLTTEVFDAQELYTDALCLSLPKKGRHHLSDWPVTCTTNPYHTGVEEVDGGGGGNLQFLCFTFSPFLKIFYEAEVLSSAICHEHGTCYSLSHTSQSFYHLPCFSSFKNTGIFIHKGKTYDQLMSGAP